MTLHSTPSSYYYCCCCHSSSTVNKITQPRIKYFVFILHVSGLWARWRLRVKSGDVGPAELVAGQRLGALQASLRHRLSRVSLSVGKRPWWRRQDREAGAPLGDRGHPEQRAPRPLLRLVKRVKPANMNPFLIHHLHIGSLYAFQHSH